MQTFLWLGIPNFDYPNNTVLFNIMKINFVILPMSIFLVCLSGIPTNSRYSLNYLNQIRFKW